MKQAGKILYTEHDGVHFLKFVGDVRLTLGPTISAFLGHLRGCDNFRAMIVDLSETEAIDSTALGLLAKVAICASETFDVCPVVVCPGDNISRLLKSMAMDRVCRLVAGIEQPGDDDSVPAELPREKASEEELLDEVLQAHRVLMTLGEENRDRFRDLVERLEQEKKPGGEPASGRLRQPPASRPDLLLNEVVVG